MVVKSKRKKSLFAVLEPYIWFLPAFLLFVVFTFYPLLETAYKSLFIVTPLGETRKFVGFENYIYILKDPDFTRSILNTLYFTVLVVPASKLLGLILALLAHRRRRLSVFYEASFAIPMAIASSVIAMVFQLLYVPSLGFINGFFGLEVQWLNDPNIAMISIAVIQIWLSTGYAFIFLLAAVRNVSGEIMESAEIDGAGPLHKIVRIYLPLISPTLFYLVITDIPFSMMMMSLTNVLTEGGPFSSTMTIMQYIYKQFAGSANFTNVNPAALVAFVMTFIFTMLGFLWEKKGVHYQ